MHYEEKLNHVEIVSNALQEAEDAMQDARNSGDTLAFGYAEQKVIRLRRELAKADPLGVGNPYLNNLTEAELNETPISWDCCTGWKFAKPITEVYNKKTGDHMKTETHTIQCADGTHEVRLDIFCMDAIEAIDVYGLPADLYDRGGWRIEGFINSIPAGTRFYSGNLGSTYYGEKSDIAAREFLTDARKNGALPTIV